MNRSNYQQSSPVSMTRDQFLNRAEKLMVLRRFAPSTRKTYKKWLEAFWDYSEFASSADITIADGQDFLLYLDDLDQYAASTLNQVTYALRFGFDAVLFIPVTSKQFPKQKGEKKEKPFFTQDQALTLIDQCRPLDLKAAICLAYGCGLRISEITHLKLSDIRKESQTLTIRCSKGNRTRTVPYSKDVQDVLNRYCTTLGREYLSQKDNYVFPSKKPGIPVKNSALTHRFKEYIQVFDFTLEGHSFHSLRHAFATALAERNYSLPSIQKVMGHASAATTANYIHSGSDCEQKFPDIFAREGNRKE